MAKIFLILELFFSDILTEIWDFVDKSNKMIDPTLPRGHYVNGIGLYIVPFNFCST